MDILKKSIFWSLYFYGGTILSQYGFNSYFGIPANLIEPSIRDNIIFFFALFKGIFYAIIHMSILNWFILLIPIIIFVIFVFLNIIPKLIVKIGIILLIILSPFYFSHLGEEIAKNKTEFPIFINECFPKKENTIYITPAFYQTTAIVVPISNDDHKITGSFFLKEPIGPECEIQTQKIGKTIK